MSREEVRPGVEFGCNADGSLDEIVVQSPFLFHLEQMSDTFWWAGVYLGPDSHDRITFDLWTPRASIRAFYALEAGQAESFDAGQTRSGIKLPPWMERR